MLKCEKYNDRLGYYKVGDEKIYNAYPALIAAKAKNAKIEWVFNDEYYRLAASKHIDLTLDELYLARAQQLREQYDYLVLNFSGGKDSINVLLTFLNNGIFLDEIVMNYPFPLKNTFNKDDKSNANFFSEIEFAAKPILEKYKNKIHPNTIIRYQDLAQPNIDLLSRDDWFDIFPSHSAFTVTNRAVSQIYDVHYMKLAMQQKRVASIFGIDKPKIIHTNGEYYFSFVDINLHSMNRPSLPEYRETVDNYINAEPFYWTPYMPEIVVKQCHIILEAMKHDHLLKTVIHDKVSDPHVVMQVREKLIAKYIYSDDEKVWQTEKPTYNSFRKMDDWFWEIAPTKAKDNFLYTLNVMQQNVSHDAFLDGDVKRGKNPHFSAPIKINYRTAE